MENGTIISLVSAAASLGFSAGMAIMSVRLVGQKVDSLKELWLAAHADQDKRIVEHKTQLHELRETDVSQGRQIAVLESKLGSLERFKAVLWGRKEGQ